LAGRRGYAVCRKRMLMSTRVLGGSFSLLLLALAIGCSNNNPAQPLSASNGTTSVGPSSVTGSITAPRPLQPAGNALIRNTDHPVTLAVQNAVVTRVGGTTYTFEYATDSAF